MLISTTITHQLHLSPRQQFVTVNQRHKLLFSPVYLNMTLLPSHHNTPCVQRSLHRLNIEDRVWNKRKTVLRTLRVQTGIGFLCKWCYWESKGDIGPNWKDVSRGCCRYVALPVLLCCRETLTAAAALWPPGSETCTSVFKRVLIQASSRLIRCNKVWSAYQVPLLPGCHREK